jgi:predicted Ser/Thr protein kinase
VRQIELEGEEPSSPERIGRYEVAGVLGHGGMGKVLRGRDPETLSSVAIKVMAAEISEDPEAPARFEREAKSLAVVDHPHVARVLDYGVLDDGAPYLVMEFVDGPSLADLIRSRVEMPYSRVARLLVEAAEGLHGAFKQKIVHRDIKPANLMLDPDGQLKIVDFGLAKHLFDNTFKTADGTVLGTPRYMSPEQSRGQTADHRSDMYSLGCSFYHLLTGQSPFEADSPMALMLMHIQKPLTPVYVINPEVPGDMAEAIHRMMAKDPSDRFEDYDDLIATLREVEMTRLAREKAASLDGSSRPKPASADPYERTGALGADPKAAAVAAMGVDVGAATATGPSAGLPVAAAGEARPAGRLIERYEPSATGKSSLLSWVVAGVALLAIVLTITTLLARGRSDETGKTRSGWAVLTSRFLGNQREVEESDAQRQRTERHLTTRERMNVLLNYCKIHMARQGSFPRRISQLIEADLVEANQTVDGWDRSFAVYSQKRQLVSFGEDGIEGNSDDFCLGDDGVYAGLPAYLVDYDEAQQDNHD